MIRMKMIIMMLRYFYSYVFLISIAYMSLAKGSPQSNWALDTSSFMDALNGQSYEETFGSNSENGYEQSYGGAASVSSEEEDFNPLDPPPADPSSAISNPQSSSGYSSKTVRTLESTRASSNSRLGADDQTQPGGYGRRKSSVPVSIPVTSGKRTSSSSSTGYSSSGSLKATPKKADQRFFVDNPVVTTPIDGLVTYGRGNRGGVIIDTLPTLPRTDGGVTRRQGSGGGRRRVYNGGSSGTGTSRRRTDEQTVRRRTDSSSTADGTYFPTTTGLVPVTPVVRRRPTSTPSVVYGDSGVNSVDERRTSVDERRTTASVDVGVSRDVGIGRGVDRRNDYDYSGVTRRSDYEYDDYSNGLDAYGRPGQDFPIFSRVPNTGFTCRGRLPGYYADTQTGCQAFYICQADGRQDGFLCPNATLFNQELFVCDYWNHVDCSMAESFYGLNGNLFQVTGCGEAVACGAGTDTNSGYGSRRGGGDNYGDGQVEVNARLTGTTNSPYANRRGGGSTQSSSSSFSSTNGYSSGQSTGSSGYGQMTSTSVGPRFGSSGDDQDSRSGYSDSRSGSINNRNRNRSSGSNNRRYA